MALLLDRIPSESIIKKKKKDRFGPEFHLLQHVTIEEISKNHEPLAAAIQAMRQNRVRRIPGYDGVYGRIILEPYSKF
jgi:PHP family Zn ribbon phosphoesterase